MLSVLFIVVLVDGSVLYILVLCVFVVENAVFNALLPNFALN